MTYISYTAHAASSGLLREPTSPDAASAGGGAARPRSSAFARTAALAAVASTPSAAGCLLLGLLAAGFDPAAMGDPAAAITRGTGSADLFYWSMILDMFGYYLLLAPASLYLWFWLSPRAPGLVSLCTAAGLAYILIGSAGAVMLAAAARPLSRAYLQASGADQEIVALAFETVTHLVYGGLWSILELILGGVWWLGIGLLLRGERPILSGLSILLGAAAWLTATGTALGASTAAAAALLAYLYSAPVWALWLGIAIARGAGARQVRAAERVIAARGAA
jgi:hypothetical protein